MVIDGIFASEAIDTSGEVLDIAGCDISSLPVDGVCNWEHRGDDSPGHTASDIVGKIISAKKIFSAKDCGDDRQLKYWKMVELPLIYGVVRLYDGAGHLAASDMAAQIRDHVANGEPPIVRYSIEGSTLEAGGPGKKKLLQSVARRVSATVKPANRTCYSGIISDSNAPEGYSKDPEGVKDEVEDPLEGVMERAEHPHPMYTRLGGAREVECDPILEDVQKAEPPRHPLWGVPRPHGVAPHVAPWVVRKELDPAPKPTLRAPPRHPAVAGAHVGILTAENPRFPHAQGGNAALKADLDRLGLKHEDVLGKYDEPENSVLVHGAHPQALLDLGHRYGQESVVYSKGGRNWLMYSHGPSAGKMFAGQGVNTFEQAPENYYTTAQTPSGPLHFSYNVDWESPRHVSELGLTVPGAQAAPQPELSKALTAGTTAGAPSGLTGGAALQREDQGLRGWANRAKAAFRDWDLTEDFRKFLKHRVPEADPAFLDRFADMVETHRVSRASLLKKEGDQAGTLTSRGKSIRPTPAVKAPVFDEQKGVLRTPRGSFPMYVPGRDPDPKARESFNNILEDPKVSKLHDAAIKNWGKLNARLKAGTLPPQVAMHATLFSQLSPNTPVGNQELMFSHLVDTMREAGIDATSPDFPKLREDWMRRDSPTELPQHARDFHEKDKRIRIKMDSKDTGRKAGDIGSFMLASNKWKNMQQYHTLHDSLTDLVSRHRDDARAGVAELMAHKVAAGKHEAQRERAIASGKPDIGPYGGPDVPGLAPKTARYMYGMIGGSNVVVPDTHFVRHLFGLDKNHDTASIEYLKSLLWNKQHSHLLEGIDRYYAQNHDAVRHLRRHKPLAHMFDSDEQATFPAFWKHWVAIGPNEAARGMGNEGYYNEGTTHEPYWSAVLPTLKRSEAHDPDPDLPVWTAAQHADWAQRYGEVPALMFYHAFLVPHLLGPDEQQDPRQLVRKLEAMAVDLRKAAAGAAEPERTPAERPSAKAATQEVAFGGQRVRPGKAHLLHSGQKLSLLGSDQDHYFAVPHEKLSSWSAADLMKLPRGQTPGLVIGQHPEVLDAGTTVDAGQHGVQGMNPTPEQAKLVHGLDFGAPRTDLPAGAVKGAWAASRSHWRKGPTGPVFVKASEEPDRPFNEARREVAYHNLAKHFFGLGKYVPTASLIRHPRTGQEQAVIEGIRNGEHGELTGSSGWRGQLLKHPRHRAALDQLNQSGDLDKLAVMNMVLGNHDRHDQNYMYTPDGGIKLIDHGLAFKMTPSQSPVPGYLEHHHNHLDRETGQEGSLYRVPMHRDALEWVKNLREPDLRLLMAENGVPPEYAEQSAYRLRNLQQHLAQDPMLSRGHAMASPQVDADLGLRFVR